MNTSSISCLISTATTPIAPPSDKRADVAHEDLGRMRVVPEEADGRAGHRAAEDGQFRGAGQSREIEILGELARGR